MVATCVPGLATLLGAELSAIDGVTVQDSGFDGRVDVVLFEANGAAASRAALELRLAEDVFVEIGRTLRSEGDRPEWISGRIWRPERVRRALEARAAMSRAVPKRATYRVIVRVLQERSFRRTDLRREFGRAVARDQPDWRPADPALTEVWLMEYQPGRLVAGLRTSDARMRQHDGRAVERSGALRPTVAAAMVERAGTPDGLLLDPCCGSGTILAEAREAGWSVRGGDVDPGALDTARYNVPGTQLEQWDVRSLPRDTLPPGLSLAERHPLRLLGTKTTLWVLHRH